MTTLPAAQQQNILAYLEKNPLLSIQEMGNELGVSSMTIRRDLNKLERDGLIQKVHGGAILAQSPNRQLVTSQKRIVSDVPSTNRRTYGLYTALL
jgi:DeoR family fructose operon transcriptional repressor